MIYNLQCKFYDICGSCIKTYSRQLKLNLHGEYTYSGGGMITYKILFS